jgi:hypothetical protein
VVVLSDDAMRTYVGRRFERRVVAEPLVMGVGAPVRFVVGDAQMGKSTMAQLVAEWRLLLGHRVVLLDCARAGGVLDALQLMRRIRGTRADGGPLCPLLYPSFDGFNDTVNAVLANRPREAVPATGVDDEKPLDRAHFPERGWEQLGAAFLDGLRTAAAAQPLTLVLDHLSRNNAGIDFDDFRMQIVPQVLVPIHRGDVANVSVVIAGTDAELDACGLRALRDTSKGVAQLGDFVREDWELLAREFAVRAQIPPQAADELILVVAGLIKTNPWRPKALLALRSLYQVASPI